MLSVPLLTDLTLGCANSLLFICGGPSTYFPSMDLKSVGIREKDAVHGPFFKNISKSSDKYCVKIMPVKEHHDLCPFQSS